MTYYVCLQSKFSFNIFFIVKIVPGTRVRAANLLSRLAAEPEGYAECYPGLREMDDAIEDSDDEADYTKMDIGNKKGPIGKFIGIIQKLF